MTKETARRNNFLDVIKGGAIFSVILYHCGIMSYGYLGVDIFLVIAGYFTTKSILKGAKVKSDFNYIGFLSRRLLRLWPLVIGVCVVSLLAGYELMLPDFLKDTAETVLGSSLFANNWVLYITSSDYWALGNNYKPLLHTWYVGLVFQFYLVYPFILLLVSKIKRLRGYIVDIMLFLAILSLIIYLLPFINIAFKFYLLPARLFEFILGGLMWIYEDDTYLSEYNKERDKISLVVLFLLFVFVCVVREFSAEEVRLLIVVSLTCVLIRLSAKNELSHITKYSFFRFFAIMGVASYSLYIWHQLFLAFYRITINDNLKIWDFCILAIVIGGVSWISYIFVEGKFYRYLNDKIKSATIVSGILTVCLLVVCLYLYHIQGVVRDVPWLEINQKTASTWSPQNYNERINHLNIDFPHNQKKNILVIGDSFARDFVNILLESKVDDEMNISYYKMNVSYNEMEEPYDTILVDRIVKSDYIFIANLGNSERFCQYWPYIGTKQYYRVGVKDFGGQNGIMYNKVRVGYNYSDLYSPINEEILKINTKEKLVYGNHYIDIMSLLKTEENEIPVFTSDGLYYSHDGCHLTKAGAKELAKILHVQALLK